MSINWEVPLQSRNGYAATVVHKYYNGVNYFRVVSLAMRPSTAGGEIPELIKIYDKWGRDCTKMERGPGGKTTEYDLMEVPPPDTTLYLCPIPETDSPNGYMIVNAVVKQSLTTTPTCAGQIKAVIDGRTGKLKSVEIV